jgi:hypothetical protein
MSITLRLDKWYLAGGLVILLSVLLGSYYFYGSWKAFSSVTLPLPDCDLRKGPCISALPSGEKIQLRIKQTHMPVLTSLQLEVLAENIPIKKMYIDFKGAEMDMGQFRYSLTPTRQKHGMYTAQTILPTCAEENMVWHGTIHIETASKHYNAPFVVVNQRPMTG